MLNQLLSTNKDQLMGLLKGQLNLSQEEAEQTIPAAEESIKEGVEKEVGEGNLGGLLSMFTGGNFTQNTIYESISESFVGKLMANVGLSADQAKKVGGSFLPQVLEIVKGKAENEEGEVSETGLLKSMGFDPSDLLGSFKDKLGGLGKLF